MTNTAAPDKTPMNPEVPTKKSAIKECSSEISLNFAQSGIQKLSTQENCSWHSSVHAVSVS